MSIKRAAFCLVATLLAVSILSTCSFAQFWGYPKTITGASAGFTGFLSYDIDNQGKLHTVYSIKTISGYSLMYSTDSTGSHTHIPVADAPTGHVFCKGDTVHVVYVAGDGIFHIKRPAASGEWSLPVRIADSSDIEFEAATDSTGRICVLYADSPSTLQSAIYDQEDGWSESFTVVDTMTHAVTDTRLSSVDDTFYAGYLLGKTGEMRVAKFLTASEVEDEYVANGVSAPLFAGTQTGELSVLYIACAEAVLGNTDADVFVMTKRAGQDDYEKPVNVSETNGKAIYGSMAYDSSGNLHVVYVRENGHPGTTMVCYRARYASVWEASSPFLGYTSDNSRMPKDAIRIKNGSAHVVFDSINSDSREGILTEKVFSVDAAAPDAVSGLSAQLNDGKVELEWKNPASSDFRATMIRASTTGFPDGPYAGRMANLSTGPLGVDRKAYDFPLPSGPVQYYSAFAQDASGNWSQARHTSADTSPVPQDMEVLDFSARPYTSEDVMLSWTNPQDADYDGVLIRYLSSGYPANTTVTAEEVFVPGQSGQSQTYVINGLDYGKKWHFTAFAYYSGESSGYSSGTCTSAVPVLQTISHIHSLPDNSPVHVPQLVVSAVFPDCIYLQDTATRLGIMARGDTAGVFPKDIVEVWGEAATVDNGSERYIANASMRKLSAGNISPAVYMQTKSIGGKGSYTLDGLDFIPQSGACNVGMLVKTSGKVTAVGEGFFYIDDGCALPACGPEGQMAEKGLKIITPYFSPDIRTEDYVSVAGISVGGGPEYFEHRNMPAITVRGLDDISMHNRSFDTGSIAGFITDNFGMPVENASVSVWNQSSVTDENGRYGLYGISPGSYYVSVSSADYPSAYKTNIRVTAGRETRCDITLQGTYGSIEGHIYDESGSPIQGAKVLINGEQVLATTGVDGSFSANRVEQGEYALKFTAADKISKRQTVFVYSGKSSYASAWLKDIQPMTDIVWQLHDRNPAHIKNLIDMAGEQGVTRIQLSHKIIMDSQNILTDSALADLVNEVCDYAHTRGVAVDIWVHEISDTNGYRIPHYFFKNGRLNLDDDRLWEWLKTKYTDTFALCPDIDGVVLTMHETQYEVHNAGDKDVYSETMTHEERAIKLIDTLSEVLAPMGKRLFVRSFAYEPSQLGILIDALSNTESDITVMSKCVPHDWQPYYPYAPDIGAVGDKPQIIEFDLGHEFTGKSNVPYIMVDYLRRHLDYDLHEGADGVVMRIERYNWHAIHTPDITTYPDDFVLPNQANIEVFTQMARNYHLDEDVLLEDWIADHYGQAAVEDVKSAFKKSFEVLNKSYFVLGFWSITNHSLLVDHEGHPNGFRDLLWAFGTQKWDPSYSSTYSELFYSPTYTTLMKISAEKSEAVALAESAVADIERARDEGKLSESDAEDLLRQFNRSLAMAKVWKAYAEVAFGLMVRERDSSPAVFNYLQAATDRLESLTSTHYHDLADMLANYWSTSYSNVGRAYDLVEFSRESVR